MILSIVVLYLVFHDSLKLRIPDVETNQGNGVLLLLSSDAEYAKVMKSIT